MKRTVLLISSILINIILNSQSLDYFLPADVTYNSSIPTPKEFTGHEVGEWHLTHDKLLFYMMELAKISERALWEEYAVSYEGRPLGQLIISSPENIRNIEKIRELHVELCDPSKSDRSDINTMPLFIKLGYGVHGNESSAQNSSTLVAYYLIAGEGKKIDELLANTVILIDPALNPDGMQRHSTWVNFTRSLNNNPDPNSWEFSENWPGGRTNHYWFDLNRDYILLQHPESRGRVAAFYKWRPNINTDHHEMEANSTFFFQPGIQSRNNPLTPSENQGLTAEIGKYHEKYLNRIGSLYYTEESYDDFYVGKGSSYPDIHGSVGILFEQAGIRGHVRNTPGGMVSFPFTIRNQFNVSLSTLEAGLNMREKLLESQKNFYKDALVEADKYPVKAYLLTEQEDDVRINELIKILLQHRIRIYKLTRDIEKNDVSYKTVNSYIVPLKQTEYRFIRSLFEPVKEFTDSLFYDVSTWVLPMLFNIHYTGINTIKELQSLTGLELSGTPVADGQLKAPEDPYAYLFEWNGFLAPRALFELQKMGIKTRVATDKFSLDVGKVVKQFGSGTIMVQVSGQIFRGPELFKIMEDVAKGNGITIYGIRTGLTPAGIDLGSNKFSVLQKPSVIMFTGEGSSSGEAGEIWHLLDTHFNIPVTMVTPQRFSAVNLDNYNVLIITGSPEINPADIEKIRLWNRNGGTIIGYTEGNNWIEKNKLAEIKFIPAIIPGIKTGIYANRGADSQVHQIPGSIFETSLDLTHPLCFGYTSDRLPVFKSGELAAVIDENIYNNPVTYTSDPLLSGYCSKENIGRIKGTAFASVHTSRVISIYGNTNFRAISYGTNKIFLNALFFGQLLGR